MLYLTRGGYSMDYNKNNDICMFYRDTEHYTLGWEKELEWLGEDMDEVGFKLRLEQVGMLPRYGSKGSILGEEWAKETLLQTTSTFQILLPFGLLWLLSWQSRGWRHSIFSPSTCWETVNVFISQNLEIAWWSSCWKSTLQCRGHDFDPWSGNIPHAEEQLSPHTTEPEFYNYWSPRA